MLFKSRKTESGPQAAEPSNILGPVRRPGKPAVPSLLSADLRIDGDVFSAGPVQIDGELQGDIRVPHLTVGVGARLSGRIDADTAMISGSVTGNIDARNVVLLPSAKVTGDILHENLTIEAGAFVDGNFKRAKKGAAEPEAETGEPLGAGKPAGTLPEDEAAPKAPMPLSAGSRK
ncbi:MAG: polymer-forming cytoskeletal protein [Kiloniellales bacterium]